MPERDWEKKLKPQTIEVHSDPILDKGSGHDRILRQMEVAYQGDDKTSPDEVIHYFMPTIKAMAFKDGLTFADEDLETPVKAAKIPGSTFGWRIVVVLRRSTVSNKNPYFGAKGGQTGERKTNDAAKGIRSFKPKDLGELFINAQKRPPVPPA